MDLLSACAAMAAVFPTAAASDTIWRIFRRLTGKFAAKRLEPSGFWELNRQFVILRTSTNRRRRFAKDMAEKAGLGFELPSKSSLMDGNSNLRPIWKWLQLHEHSEWI